VSHKQYDTPPTTLRALEQRLRNIIGSDGQAPELFSRLRQEISNVIIGQVIAGVTDGNGDPVFLIKGGVAMSFRLGLRARPTRDFDVACRIDREEAIELLRDALARGWSGFTFILKSEPQQIRDTGAVRIEIQEQFNGRIFSRVQFEMSQAEGRAGQEFDLIQHQLVELKRLGLQQSEALPMVTAAYLIAQKLHACTDHSDLERPNDRFRDLIDILLIEATLGEDELPRIKRACLEIFELRDKQEWPPQVRIVEGWAEGYADLAQRLGHHVESVGDAKELVEDLIRRIDGSEVRSPRAGRVPRAQRWKLQRGPELVAPLGDHTRYRYVLAQGEDTRDVFVEISGTAGAVDPATLPSPLDEVVSSRGASLVNANLDRIEPPARIAVHTAGWLITPRHGSYQEGDRVWVHDGGEWAPAMFLAPGDPQDAVTVRDKTTPQGRPADVAWVELEADGDVRRFTYAHIRPEPPLN
jgi:hypothetical protein